MNLEEMNLHMRECLPTNKIAFCPLNCKEIIKSIEHGKEHYNFCPNIKVKCENCP